MKTITPITYGEAAKSRGGSESTIRNAVRGGVLTRVPGIGRVQHIIEEQLMLFEGKQLSLEKLSTQEQKKWQELKNDVLGDHPPIPPTPPTLTIDTDEIADDIATKVQRKIAKLFAGTIEPQKEPTRSLQENIDIQRIISQRLEATYNLDFVDRAIPQAIRDKDYDTLTHILEQQGYSTEKANELSHTGIDFLSLMSDTLEDSKEAIRTHHTRIDKKAL